MTTVHRLLGLCLGVSCFLSTLSNKLQIPGKTNAYVVVVVVVVIFVVFHVVFCVFKFQAAAEHHAAAAKALKVAIDSGIDQQVRSCMSILNPSGSQPPCFAWPSCPF